MANNLAKNMIQTHTYHFVKEILKKKKKSQTYLCHNLPLKAFNTKQKIISSNLKPSAHVHACLEALFFIYLNVKVNNF